MVRSHQTRPILRILPTHRVRQNLRSRPVAGMEEEAAITPIRFRPIHPIRATRRLTPTQSTAPAVDLAALHAIRDRLRLALAA